jgi:hypothetical protein
MKGVTYPKGSAHPSSKVGEQEGQLFQNDGDTTVYANTTHKDTVFNGHRVQTKECSGGSGSANKSDYPKSRTKFGSETLVAA